MKTTKKPNFYIAQQGPFCATGTTLSAAMANLYGFIRSFKTFKHSEANNEN